LRHGADEFARRARRRSQLSIVIAAATHGARSHCRIESNDACARLKVVTGRADDPHMMISSEYFVLLVIAVAGSALTLYIMRRRVRIGRRSPKF
jgi:hypothetical protein